MRHIKSQEIQLLKGMVFPISELTSLPEGQRKLLRIVQEVSGHCVPRGLPRMTWLLRRNVLGKGLKIVPYYDRFKIFCDSDSFPNVMAVCGFVYRYLDRALCKIIQSPATFLDVGSNIGFVTFLACSIGYSKRIPVVAHCFEPDPNVFPYLSINQRLNSEMFKVIINPYAVGSNDCEGKLTISARSGWSTMINEPEGGFSFLPKAGETTVKIVSLDTYCRDNSISPSIIKIDVEGFECEVINGARMTIEKSRPCILIEINPLRLAAAGTSGEALIQKLIDLKYTLFHVYPRSSINIKNRKRIEWFGLPAIMQEDIVMGKDYDVIALPTEQIK